MIGKALGHYQVSSQLGKGGMGEVYQAKDQKLGRDVAIKVLPEEFARDADRVARFQREAKLLASLNHPNIAAIYGLEESAGTSFLVLELVEGDTLANQIKRGPIPVEEALKLALQIAEALEAAHEKGVIHRDLKPANIKVTPDGKVKVLDFGLAKAFAGDQEQLNLSNSPTLSNAATQQGIILGTAAYMSPEQARGKSVDKRADIWAFGVLLFEMLTGSQVFTGETISDTLAAVLTKELEWEKIPERLKPLLRSCLEKDSRKRWRDIGDVKIELERILADPHGVVVQSAEVTESRTKLRHMFSWIATTAILGIIIGGLAIWKLKPAPPHEPRQITRFYQELPADQQFINPNLPALTVSPDGKKIAYNTNKGIFLRSIEAWDARLISDANDAPSNPFFSPDARWIGYWSAAENKLKKIALSGGPPISLCDAGAIGGASWAADNTILYGAMANGIMRISSNGGTPERLIGVQGETYFHPRILPDGKTILFTLGTDEGYKIAVQSLKTSHRKVLFAGDCAWYLPTGHIVYALGNNLNAVSFDLEQLAVTGEPVAVVQGVNREGNILAPQYVLSGSGTLIYIPETAQATAFRQSTLVWVDKDGKEEPLGTPPNPYRSLAIAPDGKRIALTISKSLISTNIWTWDLARKMLTQVTLEEGMDYFPLWTHDSKRIIYLSSRVGKFSINWKSADGIGKAEPILNARATAIIPFSVSVDRKTLLLEANTGRYGDIGMMSMEGDRKWKPLLQENYAEVQPKISPDGQWMAYTSNESGREEIYVRPYPEVDKGRCQVSTSGGNSPLWSPTGQELFYRNGDSVIAVSIKTVPTVEVKAPATLFQQRFRSFTMTDIATHVSWDISPDGKRFLMMKELPAEGSVGGGPRKINIVLNWTEELKQRVPVK
jgi:serine/threonine protein kinase